MPIEFLHGRPLSQEDLDRIRLEIESLDSISVISPEMRGIVERNWPHLLPKLPPPETDGEWLRTCCPGSKRKLTTIRRPAARSRRQYVSNDPAMLRAREIPGVRPARFPTTSSRRSPPGITSRRAARDGSTRSNSTATMAEAAGAI